MFGFIKKCFFTTMMFSGCNLQSVNSLKCISLNNQVCKVRPQIVNVNSEERVFFFLLVLKQVNAVVVVIISMIHNQNCKELIDKGVFDKGFIWNLSHCECERGKLCGVGEYLDYENCKCGKKLADKLVEECTENIEEVKLAKITSAENENKHKFSSCTLYIVLFSIIFTINVGIGTCA